jgi:hypothetical protein
MPQPGPEHLWPKDVVESFHSRTFNITTYINQTAKSLGREDKEEVNESDDIQARRKEENAPSFHQKKRVTLTMQCPYDPESGEGV